MWYLVVECGGRSESYGFIPVAVFFWFAALSLPPIAETLSYDMKRVIPWSLSLWPKIWMAKMAAQSRAVRSEVFFSHCCYSVERSIFWEMKVKKGASAKQISMVLWMRPLFLLTLFSRYLPSPVAIRVIKLTLTIVAGAGRVFAPIENVGVPNLVLHTQPPQAQMSRENGTKIETSLRGIGPISDKEIVICREWKRDNVDTVRSLWKHTRCYAWWANVRLCLETRRLCACMYFVSLRTITTESINVY